MIRSIERARSEVREKIKAKEKAELQYAEGVQRQLELEIAVLKQRITELDQISQTEDHTHFLQVWESCRFLCLATKLSHGNTHSLIYLTDHSSPLYFSSERSSP